MDSPAGRLAALPALLLVLAGCGERQFRAETIWHADGRVTRAIYQHEDQTPDRAAWQTVREVDRIDIRRPDSLDHAPARPRQDVVDAERAYIVARGVFNAADRLPDHVRIEGADKSKVGRLERAVAVHDLGLVTQYVWRETLADAVTLDDMVAARHEAATLVIDLVEATLAQSKAYDTSALIAWLRGDAALWFNRSHAAIVQVALRRPDNAEEALTSRLIDIAADYGLLLRDGDGVPLPPEERQAAIARYLLAKVRETLRTTGGEPVDRAVARRLLHRLGFTGEDLLAWEASEEWKQAVHSRFSTEQAADAKGGELMTRLLGVYAFGPPRPFRYEMTVPGAVVEASGERVGTNRVRWSFRASDAFPLGYVMSCRSVAANEAVQRALLGDFLLRDVGAMADYARLVSGDAELAAAIRRCIEAGSLEPLDHYTRNTEGDAREQAQALRELLRE